MSKDWDSLSRLEKKEEAQKTLHMLKRERTKMKKLFNKWILPVCLLLIIFIQPIHYYLKGNINPAFIVFVVALLPAALKGLEYKISKKIEWIFTILAVVLLVYTLWSTM